MNKNGENLDICFSEKTQQINIEENEEEDFIVVDSYSPNQFSNNLVKNTKYTIFSFLPLIFLSQLRTPSSFFFFCIMLIQLDERFAVSSFEASLGPFLFILILSAVNEFHDDYRRSCRDKECNEAVCQKYIDLGEIDSIDLETKANLEEKNQIEFIKSADVKTGQILLLEMNKRIPADCIILKTEDENGEVFIRTDQLDGETDWKRREAVGNNINVSKSIRANIEPPGKDIYNFKGTIMCEIDGELVEKPVDLNNTVWAGTVLLNTNAFVLVIYTGNDTRIKKNTYNPRSKFGIFDSEVDHFISILIIISGICTFAFTLMRVTRPSFDALIIAGRFLVLFSYLIPIAVKVTNNMARISFANNTKEGTVVRTSTIQEDLARISYLLTDKTGTLTTNEMRLKKLYLDKLSFKSQDESIIIYNIYKHFQEIKNSKKSSSEYLNNFMKIQDKKTFDLIEALSVCHFITLVYEENPDGQSKQKITSYQSSSPDELAILNYLFSLGVKLVKNTGEIVEVEYEMDDMVFCMLRYQIIAVFPFNSDLKRMGVMAKRLNFPNKAMPGEYSDYVFFVKGADSMMIDLCDNSEWLKEDVDNMAIEGLRILVVAKKEMTNKEFQEFNMLYSTAKLAMVKRSEKVYKTQQQLERNLIPLGLTGVEDKLQENVRETIESIRCAQIRIWMLTGDKIETAISIAKSSRLVSRTDRLMIIDNCRTRVEMLKHLKKLSVNRYDCLAIDGISIETILSDREPISPFFGSKFQKTENAFTLLDLFIEIAKNLSSLVGCRFTPTQKACMAEALKNISGEIVCCVGDGGNDVSMITEANIGIGVEGKEGNQAVLASDFSIREFKDLIDLLFIHGRNCYKNSAKLTHLTIQRGVIQTVVQAIFSALINSFPLSILQGRMPMYFVIFSFLPIISITQCYDIPAIVAKSYPELYHELKRNRLVSTKEFWKSTFISYIQASIIVIGYKFIITEYTLFSIVIFITIIINEYGMIMMSQNNSFLRTLMYIGISFFCFIFSGLFMSEMNMDIRSLKSVVLYIPVMCIIALIPPVLLKLDKYYFRPASYVRLAKRQYSNV